MVHALSHYKSNLSHRLHKLYINLMVYMILFLIDSLFRILERAYDFSCRQPIFFSLVAIHDHRQRKYSKGWGAMDCQWKWIFTGSKVKRAASEDVHLFAGGALKHLPMKIWFSPGVFLWLLKGDIKKATHYSSSPKEADTIGTTPDPHTSDGILVTSKRFGH